MEAKKESKLADNEFKVSLGILKKKALIKLSNGKLSVIAHKGEIVKKFLEERLLESWTGRKTCFWKSKEEKRYNKNRRREKD